MQDGPVQSVVVHLSVRWPAKITAASSVQPGSSTGPNVLSVARRDSRTYAWSLYAAENTDGTVVVEAHVDGADLSTAFAGGCP